MKTDLAHPVLEAIRGRTSSNHFDPAARLDEVTIRLLVTHATEAPSAYNFQNWRFIAVQSAERKQALRDAAYGQQKVADAAVTFIVCGRLNPHEGLKAAMEPFVALGHVDAEAVDAMVQDATGTYADNPTMQRDEAVRSASLAAMSLMIAAEALGLASAPLGGFDPDAVRESFGLGEADVPVLLVAVGPKAPGNWPRKPRRKVDQVLTIV